MITIWKFVLDIPHDVTVKMPKDAKILGVDDQNNDLCIWAIVNSEKELEDRFFNVAGTGLSFDHYSDATHLYIGTVVMGLGALVWHVFEKA